jgi:hypothetical protein
MGGGHMGGGHMGGGFGGHTGGAHMFGPGGGAHMGGRFHDGRFDRRGNFFFAPAYGYYDDGYGYGDGCYWLRRNALDSGSPYWWNRYNACVYGY